MNDENRLVELAKLLVHRLERLSPDSTWAHQASGVRGDLIKLLERITSQEANPKRDGEDEEIEALRYLVSRGFRILENAARELT